MKVAGFLVDLGLVVVPGWKPLLHLREVGKQRKDDAFDDLDGWDWVRDH